MLMFIAICTWQICKKSYINNIANVRKNLYCCSKKLSISYKMQVKIVNLLANFSKGVKASITRDVCETLMPPSLGNINGENKRKLQIFGICKSKGHSSTVHVPSIKLHIRIILIKLYSKFHSNMFILCKENERKLKITEIFYVQGPYM